jgi:hypothetical protein
MKVVAVFQFYLPYFLSRTAEWSEAPYLQNKFDVGGQLVHLHPRKADEELFPSPIDKQLADSTIKDGAFSVSRSNVSAVANYIEEQESHHRKRTFQEEFIELLVKHGIDYDPKYVFG